MLEDFLGEHADVGWGVVHWEDTAIYLPHRDGRVAARVGLVFELGGVDANWRFTPSMFDQMLEAGPEE